MSDTLACLIALVVVVLAIIALVWFGRMSESGTASRLQAIKEGLQDWRSARSFGERILVVFAYSSLLLRAGYWAVVTAVSAGLCALGSAVCGHNPWPYIKDISFELFDKLFDTDTTSITDDSQITPRTLREN